MRHHVNILDALDAQVKVQAQNSEFTFGAVSVGSRDESTTVVEYEQRHHPEPAYRNFRSRLQTYIRQLLGKRSDGRTAVTFKETGADKVRASHIVGNNVLISTH